jgi:uncharacterized membrane protein (DUF485 family)
MKHIDILETEYKEQYNQYRWIGQMQSYVLAFYGAVTVFSFAAMAAFRPQPPAQIDYRWPAVVMIVLGFLGILVGYGLFRSRTMQRRTGLYLKSLLLQMTNSAEDYSSLKESSLRFRSLASTKGRFKLWDTMNIAILIAFYSGESFVLAGFLAFIVVGGKLCLSQAVLIGVVLLVALFVLTPIIVQRLLMDKETKRMKEEYRIANKIRLDQMGEHFELPKVESNKEVE